MEGQIMKTIHSSGPESVCRELSGMFQGMLSWKWDDRYQTALAEFNIDNRAYIHDALIRRLDRIWDGSTIETAPEAVRMITDAFGGIMSGQLLFTSDPDRNAFVFCAWWPWGNGETISIRLAPYVQKPPDSDSDGQILQLKEWFGIRE